MTHWKKCRLWSYPAEVAVPILLLLAARPSGKFLNHSKPQVSHLLKKKKKKVGNTFLLGLISRVSGVPKQC